MVAVSTLAACGEEPKAAAPAPVVAKKKVEVPPPPTIVAQVDYMYSPINKRDPFRGLFIESADANAVVNPEEEVIKGCTEPLCQYDLDELSVVAVVSGDANPLAMVEDKAGTGFVVRRNTRMGKQGGKVTQVLRDCIVVTSFITGPDGKAQPNKQNMCVKTDARSKPPVDLLVGKPYQ